MQVKGEHQVHDYERPPESQVFKKVKPGLRSSRSHICITDPVTVANFVLIQHECSRSNVDFHLRVNPSLTALLKVLCNGD